MSLMTNALIVVHWNQSKFYKYRGEERNPKVKHFNDSFFPQSPFKTRNKPVKLMKLIFLLKVK